MDAKIDLKVIWKNYVASRFQPISVLTKAIQEQQEVINEQQKENNALANRISKLESLVEQLITSIEMPTTLEE